VVGGTLEKAAYAPALSGESLPSGNLARAIRPPRSVLASAAFGKVRAYSGRGEPAPGEGDAVADWRWFELGAWFPVTLMANRPLGEAISLLPVTFPGSRT